MLLPGVVDRSDFTSDYCLLLLLKCFYDSMENNFCHVQFVLVRPQILKACLVFKSSEYTVTV